VARLVVISTEQKSAVAVVTHSATWQALSAAEKSIPTLAVAEPH